MQSTSWDGITKAETLNGEEAARRQRLATLSKANDWSALLSLLSQQPELVNVVRPGSRLWFSPLHFAAYGGAPADVVKQLLELGAWRTLRTAKGEQAVDIAQRRGHNHLVTLLTLPKLVQPLSTELLEAIQGHFHTLITRTTGHVVKQHKLRLPQLDVMLELDEPAMGFTVPGMYGGFYYRLEHIRNGALLHSESWSRIVSGSAEYHVVSSEGSLLVAAAYD